MPDVNPSPMIRGRALSKSYQLGQIQVPALRDISLEVNAGEFVAIAGASGSGKSTLLNLLGGIEPPSSGQIEVQGTSLSELTSDQLADWRARHLGFVFQTFNLLSVLTVFENVEFPLQLQRIPPEERIHRVREALTEVGLSPFERHKPAQLSGGQRQRVAIARALIGGPSLVLADEPTANLDHRTGLEILDLMKQLNKKRTVTLLFATHDSKIMRMADRVIELEDGRVVMS